MKPYLTATLLLPILAIGQTFTTHDSRFGITPEESAYTSIDIAVTDLQRNPDYDPIMRVPAAPALVDVTHKLGVSITGTVAQAEAELAAIPRIPPQFPHGIETPWITLLSVSNQSGWLYVAMDDGTLVPVLAHQSPWPSQAEIEKRIKDAATKARANKQTAKDGINGQLQKRIENLERLLGIRE